MKVTVWIVVKEAGKLERELVRTVDIRSQWDKSMIARHVYKECEGGASKVVVVYIPKRQGHKCHKIIRKEILEIVRTPEMIPGDPPGTISRRSAPPRVSARQQSHRGPTNRREKKDDIDTIPEAPQDDIEALIAELQPTADGRAPTVCSSMDVDCSGSDRSEEGHLPNDWDPMLYEPIRHRSEAVPRRERRNQHTEQGDTYAPEVADGYPETAYRIADSGYSSNSGGSIRVVPPSSRLAAAVRDQRNTRPETQTRRAILLDLDMEDEGYQSLTPPSSPLHRQAVVEQRQLNPSESAPARRRRRSYVRPYVEDVSDFG